VLEVQADFEKEKASLIRAYEKYGEDLSSLDTEERWAEHFESVKYRRAYQHRYTVEHGLARKKDEDRFGAYVLAMQARLRRHNFTRSFELDRDPSKQDKLTTWIEYLNHEYWFRDSFSEEADLLQPQYEAALKDLLDANVLLPGETPESVVAFEHDFERESEIRSAEKAVKAAESVVSAAQQSLNETAQSMRRQAQETALERAQERLDKARDTAKAAEKRCELIGKFVGICSRFRKAQENAQKHRLLLEWILNEMHSVEEMDGAQPGSSSRRKRARRNSDGELGGAKRPKAED
jgi:hypothetical protein